MTATNRRFASHAATLILASVLAGAATAAERTINETRAVDADAEISIENLAGSIEVTGWDRQEVQITGTLDEKAEKLEISGGGQTLSIEVRYPERRNLNIKRGSVLVVKVPRGCDLDVEAVSADISVADLHGEISAESVSGDVTVRGKPSGLEVDTVSGEIDVTVDGIDVSLASVSGDIVAKGVAGDVEAETVSGELEVVAGGPVRELSLESVSGSLLIDAAPGGSARWAISSHSGNVDLALPAGVDADFSIESFSGNIRDGFGHEAARTDKFAPGSELNFTQGKGGARIEIETFSGDVVIRKK